MAGKIQGMYFKAVLGPLLGAGLLMPEQKRRVDEMQERDWYDWDEYKALLAEVSSKLSPYAVTSIGFDLMVKSKDSFLEQGFDSAEKILSDWGAFFRQNVIGAPADDAPRTAQFTPGHVVIESGPAQPKAIVEGYIRGALHLFGKVPLEVKVDDVADGRGGAYRLEVQWS